VTNSNICLHLQIPYPLLNYWISFILLSWTWITLFYVLSLKKLKILKLCLLWVVKKLLDLMGLQLYFMLNTGIVLNLQSIGNFFTSNQLLREHNHTFLALILKRLGPSAVHHFCPISLCNIIYKIISKLLANRLKPLLSKIISPF
jgi:hypothetical protein